MKCSSREKLAGAILHSYSASLKLPGISPERSLYPDLSPVFVATEQQTSLDHLALVASGAIAHGFHQMVTNERFLNQIKLARGKTEFQIFL